MTQDLSDNTESLTVSHGGHSELVDHMLSGIEVFAQSLAASGPSVALALTPSLVFLTAGVHTIWSFIVAVIIVLLVGLNVASFARRRAAAGSLYTWTAAGLGRLAAFAGGWGIVIGYAGIAAVNIAGVALFGSAIVSQAGGNGDSLAVRIPILLAAAVVVLAIPLRGIQISSRIGLVLEVLSLIALAILFIAVLVHNGAHFDSNQFHISSGSVNSIFVGAVLATSAFVGFESAGSLGAEARHPHRTIPRVIIGIVLVIGGLYVVGSYIQVLGFETSKDLAASASPLNALAGYAKIPNLAYVLDVGLIFATLGCASATLNAAGRAIYSFGREGVLATAFGRTHSRFRTPHVALTTTWVVTVLVPLIFLIYGTDLLTSMGYIATIATFGFLVTYLLVALACPVYLGRIGEFKIGYAITGALAAASIAYVIWNNLVPTPPSPYNRLPYVFLIIWAVGIIWYAVLSVARPERARQLGTLHEDAAGVS